MDHTTPLSLLPPAPGPAPAPAAPLSDIAQPPLPSAFAHGTLAHRLQPSRFRSVQAPGSPCAPAHVCMRPPQSIGSCMQCGPHCTHYRACLSAVPESRCRGGHCRGHAGHGAWHASLPPWPKRRPPLPPPHAPARPPPSSAPPPGPCPPPSYSRLARTPGRSTLPLPLQRAAAERRWSGLNEGLHRQPRIVDPHHIGEHRPAVACGGWQPAVAARPPGGGRHGDLLPPRVPPLINERAGPAAHVWVWGAGRSSRSVAAAVADADAGQQRAGGRAGGQAGLPGGRQARAVKAGWEAGRWGCHRAQGRGRGQGGGGGGVPRHPGWASPHQSSPVSHHQ